MVIVIVIVIVMVMMIDRRGFLPVTQAEMLDWHTSSAAAAARWEGYTEMVFLDLRSYFSTI